MKRAKHLSSMNRVNSCIETLERRRLLASPVNIALGDVKSGNIAAADTAIFLYSGKANDIVSLALADTASHPFYPTGELIDPDAATVGEFGRGGLTQFTLPKTGTYQIRVHDDNYTESGKFSLGLEGLKPASPAAVAISSGKVVSGSIALAAEVDQLSFSGQTGDVIRIAMADTASHPYYPTGDLISPAGAIIGAFGRGGQTAFTLGASGTYLLQIHDDNTTETGTYTVGLERVKPTAPDALYIIPGQLTNGAVGAAQVNLYRFYGQSGEHVSVVLSDTAAHPYYPTGVLYSPAGAVVGAFGRGGKTQFTLPATGDFLLQLSDDNTTESGTTQLRLDWDSPLDGSISGQKFNDANGNGAKDSGEAGLAGWTIYLDADNDGVLDAGERSAITDSTGNYAFTSLSAATYNVREVGKSGWTQTAPAGGAHAVAVTLGQNVTGKNFANKSGGVSEPGSIAGQKFNDLDGDGVKDAGEAGLSGWTIFLDSDKDGVKDAAEPSVATDASGNYKFADLAAGSYRVREVDKAGWQRTAPASGYYDVALTSGQNVTAKNFGNKAVTPAGGSIAGVVFSDADKDGVLDAADPRLSGKKMFIDKDNDGVLDAGEPTTLSNASGEYKFAGLASGSYRIRRADLPANYYLTVPASGYYDIALTTGQNVTGKHFGAAPKGTNTLGQISGTLFSDLDGDGVKDAGEGGLQYRRIFIDADKDGVYDPEEKFGITDASGNWSISGLAAGTYVVRMVKQAGWNVTTPGTGAITITLTAGQSKTGVLFGEHHI